MSNKRHNFSIRLANNLTPEELKDAAAGVDLPLLNIHSGKKLSEVPYDEIAVGMEVVSMGGIHGKVGRKVGKGVLRTDNCLTIEWENGNESSSSHYMFDLVKVK